MKVKSTFTSIPFGSEFTRSTDSTICRKITGGYIKSDTFFPIDDDDFELMLIVPDQVQPNLQPLSQGQQPMNHMSQNVVVNMVNQKRGGRIWRIILWGIIGFCSFGFVNLFMVILELLSGTAPFQ